MSGLTSLERFLETATSPYRIGLTRIPIGMVCLLDALVTRRDLGVLFHPDALRVPHFSWLPVFQPSQSDIYIGLWIAAGVLFTVGLFTRASGAILVLCFAYRLALDQTLYTTNIYLCGLIVLLFVIGNAGTAVSVDQLRRRGSPRAVLRWPQTLLKLQISLVYFFTAVENINPGVLDGESYGRFLPAVWDCPRIIYEALPVVVIGFELLLSVALWSRRTQAWAFFLGLLFHTAILFQIGFFAALMAYSTMFVGTYFLFIDEEAMSRKLAGPAMPLKWLRRFDWLRVHDYEPGLKTLSLDTGQRQLTGWPAFKQARNVLPVTCLGAAVFDLPLVSTLGRAAYERLAIATEAPPYAPVSP